MSALVVFAPIAGLAQNSEVVCGQSYTVAPGDTLSKISTKAYGVSAFEVLIEANKEALADNPNLLFVGQKLAIPCRDNTQTAAATTKPVAKPDATPDGPVVLTFNKASDPRFVINSGIIDPFLERVESLTEGRVKFIDPPEMNRDPSAQFDLVTSGQVDATYVLNSYLADTHPLLQIPMIPLMGGSAQQTAISLWNLHDRYLSETDYFDDAHLVGFIAAPAAHVWHDLNDPVTAGENILNQNDYPVPYFEGLDTIGPKRVQAQNAQTYGAQDTATDGPMTFMMAHGAARGAGIWNDERGVTEVENGIYTPTFSVIISNDAWARISPKDQNVINVLSGLTLAQRSGAWDDFDNGHRQIMLDTGLEVEYPDGPLLREIEENAQLQLASWSRAATDIGIPAEQAIAAYRADLASLRYLLIFR
ncbi:MAG: LysM peptidoglycan-binding domain-containing protein [Sulfitobacter sp.]